MPQVIVFFESAAVLKHWFAGNAATATEVAVGFMKKSSGVPSITWPEAVDEALCVGWIDGVRHRIDDQRYKIRFTPRRSGSHWSHVNIRRVAVLKADGRMKAGGLAAFAARQKTKTGRAAYEQKQAAKLSPPDVKEFKRNAAAWTYYGGLPPGYRQKVNWWIISAKKPETREQRLRRLIEACAKNRRL